MECYQCLEENKRSIAEKGYGYGYGYGVKEEKIPWYKKVLKI